MEEERANLGIGLIDGLTTDNRFIWTRMDGSSFAIRGAVEPDTTTLHQVVSVRDEEKEEEKEEVKEEPIEDVEPFMIFKEEYIKKELDGNEEIAEDVVKLHIVKQDTKNFDKRAYIDYNGIASVTDMREFYRVEGDFYFVLASRNSCDLQYEDDRYIVLWVKGDYDFDEEKSVDIPISDYENVKKCLIALDCLVIEDESKGAKEESEEELTKISYIFNNEPTEEELDQMISLVDLDTFNNIIRARMIQDEDSLNAGKVTKKWAKEYLKEWAINKYRFYKIFGDKLTLETDIEVELDESEARTILYDLISKFPLYRRVFNDVFNSAVVKDNIGNKRDLNIDSYFFEDSRVKANMSFTKFMSLFGNEKLNIEVSKIYQNKGIAHLTISINPIDYLTVSINHSGWRSCHNFINGEWRNAGLSYMFDKTSMVSYRSNGLVDYNIHDKKFKWNSKNWRQMIYVSEKNSAMVFSRQYPNENDNIAKNIRRILEEQISNYFGGSNKWKIYNHQSNAEVSVDSPYGLLYNDVDEGFGHRVAKAKDDSDFERYHHIDIGNNVNCISSDKEYLEEENSNIWRN